MEIINENDLSRVDLNLLVVLLVMYDTRSVTGAAQRLYLGQPAVSAALKRLRELFGDPLFVRSSQGMMPTPRAERLVQQCAPLLQDLHRVIFSTPAFNPRTDRYSFRLGMSDWIEQWLMPDLLAELMMEAPGVDITVLSADPWQAVPLMEKQLADVVVTVGNPVSRDLTRAEIAHAGFSTLWDSEQIPLTTTLTLAEFVRYEHVLVSYRGANESALDEQLQQQGAARRVRYVTPHFSALPMMLKRLPLFATVPQGLVRNWCERFALRAAPVPVVMPDYSLSLLWHNARHEDDAHRWMREKLRQLVLRKLA
ncbi:LysR family transcriptional regulator [Pantoea sp. At-9b]|uniref:LysR family transcriptional regulator n=1 Tax=Pantoea sp. (strain At-9b) TaxID=592316 RepID=UPI0001B3E85C|nr:LysR family transcriptional regulator [Pantoea sp. At-9b]ADU71598.1 transcriptional regulator, LysR family [Pantoea sp. At-9b]